VPLSKNIVQHKPGLVSYFPFGLAATNILLIVELGEFARLEPEGTAAARGSAGKSGRRAGFSRLLTL